MEVLLCDECAGHQFVPTESGECMPCPACCEAEWLQWMEQYADLAARCEDAA